MDWQEVAGGRGHGAYGKEQGAGSREQRAAGSGQRVLGLFFNVIKRFRHGFVFITQDTEQYRILQDIPCQSRLSVKDYLVIDQPDPVTVVDIPPDMTAVNGLDGFSVRLMPAVQDNPVMFFHGTQ